MKFELNAEQCALQESVRSLLNRTVSCADVRASAASASGYDPQVWQRLAGLGVAGLAIPESDGGSGGGLVELAVVGEELGYTMLPSPFLSSAVLTATVLVSAATSGIRSRLLSAIASGERAAALAFAQSPGDWLRASLGGAGWTLDGTAGHVMDGHSADVLVVAAEVGTGVELFTLDCRAAGVRTEPEPVLDSTRPLAHVELRSAAGDPIPMLGKAEPALRRARLAGAVVLAAEQVGGIRRCLDMSVGYAKARVQFGRPIGSFQAVKHMCADMYGLMESARATVHYAAWAVDNAADDTDAAVSLSKSYCSDAFRRAAGDTIQIHGGIGFTWEHDVHLLYRRAWSSAALFGTATEHRELLAEWFLTAVSS